MEHKEPALMHFWKAQNICWCVRVGRFWFVCQRIFFSCFGVIWSKCSVVRRKLRYFHWSPKIFVQSSLIGSRLLQMFAYWTQIRNWLCKRNTRHFHICISFCPREHRNQLSRRLCIIVIKWILFNQQEMSIAQGDNVSFCHNSISIDHWGNGYWASPITDLLISHTASQQRDTQKYTARNFGETIGQSRVEVKYRL